jgi:hypothetical protein
MKKTKNLASKILDYIRHNEKEQEIPKGFKSIEEWIVILKCSRRFWGLILPGLMRSKNAEVVKIKRVKGDRICMFNYYKINEKFLKELASR